MKKHLDKLVLVIASTVLTLLVLTVTWQVVSRYVLGSPSTFTDEFSRFSLIWVGMLSSTYAFSQKAHLSIGLLETKLKKHKVAQLNIFIYLVAAIFIVFVMIIGGGQLALRTMTEISPSLGWPMGAVYLIVPITGIFNTLYLLIYVKESFEASKKLGGVK